jgi:pyruvate/2-oxoglutarate dehydrogenase complex dihydrolipoamide dehydrogenase (E3) component
MQHSTSVPALARSPAANDGASGPIRKSGASESVAGGAITTDICIIGAGSGGLSVAEAAAAFGRSVVLIEKHKMGGDCLNFGCVPSKALLAAAKRAELFRTAGQFGISPIEPDINHHAVNHHVKTVIAAVAPNDSYERFTGLGVRVILGAGRFLDKKTVLAGDYRITARRFVIATGSSPVVPPIPGLEQIPYFTNETIFDNDRKIPHLVILGGGPNGLELAQAHRRLGSRVTVIESARALGSDDPELTAVVLKQLRSEGIDIVENAAVSRVENVTNGVRLHVSSGSAEGMVDGSHLLLAAGRRANIAELNLDDAGIRHDKHGITVNSGLRTSNSRVYAIGDVTGSPHFTHVANYHAEIVIRRALFWQSAKVKAELVPRVTYTDPELAHVGLTEQEATEKRIPINVLRWSYHENDRAQAEHTTRGHIKVVTSRKGRILGATIAGAAAGELIQMWALALSQRLNIKAMTQWVAPYPTLGEINRRAASRFYVQTPANPFVRRIINFLARFG